mgnify:CR=1 FL=1
MAVFSDIATLLECHFGQLHYVDSYIWRLGQCNDSNKVTLRNYFHSVVHIVESHMMHTSGWGAPWACLLRHSGAH